MRMTEEQPMIIKEIILREMSMRLNAPFTTSFGTVQDKPFYVVELIDEKGNNGWGETVAFSHPWYSEETTETNRHMIEDILGPMLLNKQIDHPHDVQRIFSAIRRNNMAKSALEGAVWDLYAKRLNKPLAHLLGGTKKTIDVGISLGIENKIDDLLHTIQHYVDNGYKRIKVKIKPGWDVEVIRRIREQFPDLPLMADANSAYTLEDIQLLKKLDAYELLMIEQPLAHDDIVDHATLQKNIKTPICLDESIHSYEDARKAIELGSCKIINLKIARVGGLTEAKNIHDLCVEKNIGLWCGGMLEAGIGRAHNIAITTLPGFNLPGDTAASSRYWQEDIIDPEVEVDNGVIHVPSEPGIGYKVDRKKLAKYTRSEKRLTP